MTGMNGRTAISPLRVLIVDDHLVVREGLRAILDRQPDMAVVAEAGDGGQAIDLFERHRPDLTLMDLRLPGKSGVEVTAEIRQRYPQARIVVLTVFDGDEDIYRALQAGARSYLLKSASHEELLSTLRAVAAGGRPLPPAVAERLIQRFEHSELTPRELDVLGLIAAGKSNKRIAALLGVGEGTVKTHVNRILAKLGVEDRTQAATQALRRGLIRRD
jgi:DNA-binding NarL/FixJ family response regulator